MSKCSSMVDTSQQGNKHTFDDRQRWGPDAPVCLYHWYQPGMDVTSCGWNPDLCLLLLATWARPLLSSHTHTFPGPSLQHYKQPICFLHRVLWSHSYWLLYHKQSTEENSKSYEISKQKEKYLSNSILCKGNGLIYACCFHPCSVLLWLHIETNKMSETSAFIPISL